MGSNSRKIIKFFLASPGDMQDERKIVKGVVREFNDLWADVHGYQVELVGWEDTVSRAGRPQAIINQDLEQCEYFIGMIWQRWGTPPDKTGKYSSGFEEEFETSLARWKKHKRPEISLFFKDIDAEQLNDIGPQLKQVLKFKERIVSGKTVLFEAFNGGELENFKFRINLCITRYVQKLMGEEEEDQDSLADNAELRAGNNGSAFGSSGGVAEEAVSFLQEFSSSLESADGVTPMAAVDVARYRLLGCMLPGSGNDTQTLGVHDANILFKSKDKLELGHSEQLALIASGLENYSSEVVPLWHWLEESDSLSRHWLAFKSTLGEEGQQIGALKALRLISGPLPSSQDSDRAYYLNSWFSADASDRLKIVALRYLAVCGVQDDLPTIKAEVNRSDYQTKNAALEAYIQILLRDSRDKALAALVELQPETVPGSLIRAVFCLGETIDAEILLEASKHRNSDVRYHAVKSLRRCNLLSEELATSLLSDDHAATRFEALQTLQLAGVIFSDDDAKKIIVKPKAISPPTAFGFTRTTPDTEGEKNWDAFYRDRLNSKTGKELEGIAKQSNMDDYAASMVLSERTYNKKGDELRTAVIDQYRADFAQKLERLKERFPDLDDKHLVDGWKRVEEDVRRDATRQGLDVICRAGNPSDLSLIRSVLESGFVDYSEFDLEYLRKYGEWKDITLISSLATKSRKPGAGLMQSYRSPEEYIKPANVVYKLGQHRLSELLFLEVHKELLVRVVVISTDKNFGALDDSTLIKLFDSEHDNVRKATALKCIRSLPKKRLAKLLDGYSTSGLRQFYNVVHWLDFGISIPRDRAREAVIELIKEEWAV